MRQISILALVATVFVVLATSAFGGDVTIINNGGGYYPVAAPIYVVPAPIYYVPAPTIVVEPVYVAPVVVRRVVVVTPVEPAPAPAPVATAANGGWFYTDVSWGYCGRSFSQGGVRWDQENYSPVPDKRVQVRGRLLTNYADGVRRFEIVWPNGQRRTFKEDP